MLPGVFSPDELRIIGYLLDPSGPLLNEAETVLSYKSSLDGEDGKDGEFV